MKKIEEMNIRLFLFDKGILLLRFSKVMCFEMFLFLPIYIIGRYTYLLL